MSQHGGMTPEEVEVEPSVEWRKITCAEREAIVRERGYYYPDQRAGGLSVHSSLTDHYGQYGLPKVFTEWGTYEGEPVLRDVRHPAEGLEHNPDAKDRLPCEHYAVEVEVGRRNLIAELREGETCGMDISVDMVRDLIKVLEGPRPLPTREQIERALRKRLVESNFNDNLHEPMRTQTIDQWVDVLAGSVAALFTGGEES